MKKILLVLALLVLSGTLCYSQDGGEHKTTEGTVSSVDWVGSVIIVNDISISVPSGMSIRKGDDTIGLDDVNIGDPVVVTYYTDSSGNNRAVNVLVQYNGEFAV
ncbi:MAG: hypothetical protein WCY36_07790 [Candidatus Omnitrophota bacterium]